MKYYIGIDGGGTKTIFAIADENGCLLGIHRMGSANYKQIGVKGLISLLKQGIREVISLVHEDHAEVAAVCFGMPAYGESPENDEKITAKIRKELAMYPFYIVNDCEVGWAGSLSSEPGINIVAGTGSIAFGKNAEGESGRCGGWSEWFSDEGSGRWLGMRCMEIFFKEADGRLEKGVLHELVLEYFHVNSDIEVIDIFENTYLPYRDKMASLQKILSEAAKLGDINAINAYEDACEELFLIVNGLRKRLFKDKACTVSYSGGIFHNREFLLKPFKEKIEKAGMKLTEPKEEPYVGAVLLAYEFVKGKKLLW